MSGPWSHFTSRHEQLHAVCEAPAQDAQPIVEPTPADEASDISDPSPEPADPEADLVEKAALAAEDSDSSLQSSLSSVDSDNHAPLELRMPGSGFKFACNGPWGAGTHCAPIPSRTGPAQLVASC